MNTTCCRTSLTAVLAFLSLAAHAQGSGLGAHFAPSGGIIAALFAHLFPTLSPGVLAGAVALSKGSAVIVLTWLGATTALRMMQARARAGAPPPVPPARVRIATRSTSRADPLARARVDPDTLRKRIRDRFFQLRFDGALQGFADLADSGKIVRVARIYFEDGRGERAEELLQLALRHYPNEKAYWLARLEIRFLLRDATRFVEIAEAFSRVAPDAPEWDEIRRLGVRLAPGAALFAGYQTLDDDHYGPWPKMPNWIQSSWDLTPEVIASEFHQRMRKRIEHGRGTEGALGALQWEA